jgi:hypothetical protein
MTGDPSAFVVAESFDTYLSGPNRVLAVTLADAWHVLDAGSRDSAVIGRAAASQMLLLESALRVAGVRGVLAASGGRRRITPYERRQTAKMRAYIYRLASMAASLLEGVQVLDASSLGELFGHALLPSLEMWRRFELACVLEVAFSLSKASGRPIALDIAFSPGKPVAVVGPLQIFWQYAVRPRIRSDLDEGEKMARDLAASLSVDPGTRRADIAIENDGTLVALVECKWFSSEGDARPATADACDQLVAYARDHVALHGGNAGTLLSDSVVALASRGSVPWVGPGSPIGCVDFADIESGNLDSWAAHLAAPVGVVAVPP